MNQAVGFVGDWNTFNIIMITGFMISRMVVWKR
jgi:hypothetical protein